ncbi:MAG: LamG-like jellyroll fold domain-containing protein [Candidatus Nezhaarchaeales archaeon]
MSARRVLRSGGLFFDGIDDYVKIEPFTVYGWKEITIAEWIYPCWPKANSFWSKSSMIGDMWVDYPSTFFTTDNRTDYTALGVSWTTRRADGTKGSYDYSIYAYRNSWVHVVRRFTSAREYSLWINGSKVASWIIPSTEKTVLEWNPDTATYPDRYKRFVLGANSRLDEWMKCMYDEVRIYNRALSDGEIKAVYERDEIIKDGLVLYLDFSEYEGSTAYDKSGMGNHGTIYGGARWVVKKSSRVLPSAR